jgi:hypothetical protein
VRKKVSTQTFVLRIGMSFLYSSEETVFISNRNLQSYDLLPTPPKTLRHRVSRSLNDI